MPLLGLKLKFFKLWSSHEALKRLKRYRHASLLPIGVTFLRQTAHYHMESKRIYFIYSFFTSGGAKGQYPSSFGYDEQALICP